MAYSLWSASTRTAHTRTHNSDAENGKQLAFFVGVFLAALCTLQSISPANYSTSLLVARAENVWHKVSPRLPPTLPSSNDTRSQNLFINNCEYVCKAPRGEDPSFPTCALMSSGAALEVLLSLDPKKYSIESRCAMKDFNVSKACKVIYIVLQALSPASTDKQKFFSSHRLKTYLQTPQSNNTECDVHSPPPVPTSSRRGTDVTAHSSYSGGSYLSKDGYSTAVDRVRAQRVMGRAVVFDSERGVSGRYRGS
ncbi:hypothetical protein BV25DRAFT_1921959 [Artomyces pyxidatus]|uniref:Uncharacterized protein n=1 Tax=Artomyces pyxidatus TaxID=48021 RepID=A0ACB8SH73_9AGAM|nr:hypothetical protein BV25DRAFT_1921959 [Artomyces pyxidatus]